MAILPSSMSGLVLQVAMHISRFALCQKMVLVFYCLESTTVKKKKMKKKIRYTLKC